MKKSLMIFVLMPLFMFGNLITVAQTYKGFGDIVHTASYIQGDYIPADLNEAMKVLDTLYSGKIREMAEMGYRAGLLAYISIGNSWHVGNDSRLLRNLRAVYGYAPGRVSPQEDFGFLMNEIYVKKVQDENFDPDDYMRKYCETHNQISNKSNRRRNNRGFRARFKRYFDKRNEMGELVRGMKVFYNYPFGCSSKDEADIALNSVKDGKIIPDLKDNFPMGVIEKVDYRNKRILIRLLKAKDSRGIILYDGHIERKFSETVNSFYNQNQDVLYLKEGESLWYGFPLQFWTAM